MADTTEIAGTNPEQQPQLPQGVSTPPDNGNVISVNTPANQIQVTSQGQPTSVTNSPSVQNTQATTQASTQAKPATQTQQSASTAAPATTPQPTVPVAQKPASSLNPQEIAPLPVTSPAAVHASHFSQIATILTGGPRYTYKTDADGNMVKTPAPPSKTGLAMALALEAISGALAGSSAKGTNAVGEAGVLGIQQGDKIRQERLAQDQIARQTASQDFSRKMQVTNTNMQLFNNARLAGQQSLENNEKLLAFNKPLVDEFMTNHKELIDGVGVPYSQFKNYDVTQDTALPYQIVPRLDPATGKQVSNKAGIPQWDMTYLLIKKPTEAGKASGLVTAPLLNTLKEHNVEGADNPHLLATPAGYAFWLGKQAQAAGWATMDNTLKDFQNTLNQTAAGTTYEGLKPTTLSDPTVNAAINAAAKTFSNVPVELIQAIVKQESGGNPNVKDSDVGAQGVMQILPATQKLLGVTNPHDVTQNINGGTHYLSSLMTRYNGEIPKVIAAYFDGPQNVPVKGPIPDTPKTQAYVQSVSAMLDLDKAKQTPNAQSGFQLQPISEVTKQDRSFNDAETAFQGALAAAGDGPNQWGRAMAALQKSNPTAAAKMLNYLGGQSNINKFDLDTANKKLQAAADIQKKKAEDLAENKEELDQKFSQEMLAYIQQPSNFQLSDDMVGSDPVHLRQSLAAQGVKIPDNFGALWEIAHYRSPLTALPARVWAKGSPGEMDAQTGLTYIQQFINPEFQAQNYQTANKLRMEISALSPKNPIINAGTATMHLQMLKEAAPALHDGDLATLNNIANRLGVETGKSAPVVFSAIADKVGQEVEKVAAGGNVPYEQALRDTQKKLGGVNAANAPQITDGVVRAYTGLMYGRLKAIDDDAYSTLQQHLWNVSPETTQLFEQYGYDIPWKNSKGLYGFNTPQKSASKPNPVIPAGEVWKVKGSDGQWHKTNAQHQDLGVIQQ